MYASRFVSVWVVVAPSLCCCHVDNFFAGVACNVVVSSILCAVTKMLPELDNLGRGRRVKKVHWDEGSFWHIVDAKIAEKKPQEDVASEEIKETLKRISGVKFRNNVPQTGRVCTILDAGKHSWVLLDNS